MLKSAKKTMGTVVGDVASHPATQKAKDDAIATAMGKVSGLISGLGSGAKSGASPASPKGDGQCTCPCPCQKGGAYSLKELKALASMQGIRGRSKMNKSELLWALGLRSPAQF